jgi:hypothetical protein
MTIKPHYLLVLDSSIDSNVGKGPYVADVYHANGGFSAKYLAAVDYAPPREHDSEDEAPITPAWKVEPAGDTIGTAFVADADVAAVIDLGKVPQDVLLEAIGNRAPDAIDGN